MKPVSTKALFLSIATGTALAMTAGSWVGVASAASATSGNPTAPFDSAARTAPFDTGIATAPNGAARGYQDQYQDEYAGRVDSVASRDHALSILQQNGFERVQSLRLVTSTALRGSHEPARQYYVTTGWRHGGHYHITADTETGEPTSTTRIAPERDATY